MEGLPFPLLGMAEGPLLDTPVPGRRGKPSLYFALTVCPRYFWLFLLGHPAKGLGAGGPGLDLPFRGKVSSG